MRRILVIDDDPVYRELLAIGLEAEGYDVLVAENGVRAKEILSAEGADVVLVDLLMPLMDGLRFIHWWRETHPGGAPVLVLTSMDSRALAVEAVVAGATDVIVKPVSLPALVEKLRALERAGEEG